MSLLRPDDDSPKIPDHINRKLEEIGAISNEKPEAKLQRIAINDQCDLLRSEIAKSVIVKADLVMQLTEAIELKVDQAGINAITYAINMIESSIITKRNNIIELMANWFRQSSPPEIAAENTDHDHLNR